ncbi:MAG: dienelactone hydrolase family protein [Gemmatimonadaceae bacterium]
MLHGTSDVHEDAVQIPLQKDALDADRMIPAGAYGLVIFAHGSGSSRKSERNRAVAEALGSGGLATLLLDLLTRKEERIDIVTRQHRFDIDLLATRLVSAIEWARQDARTAKLPIGLFGASTGAAAALVAAAAMPNDVAAVVSRGGRPDLAGTALARVQAPTLLVVGGNDLEVLGVNKAAQRQLHSDVRLEIVPGASHLFEEPGTLERVAKLALDWFNTHLAGAGAHARA